jgi:cyclic beta-1,2-glucan synthetase
MRARGGVVGYRPPACDPGQLPARILAARRNLESLERDLRLVRVSPDSGGDPNSELLELRANARLLRASIRAVSSKPQVIARLPRVVLPAQKDEPRAAAIATAYLRAVEGDFSAPSFREFVRALQEHDPLTLYELWNVAAFSSSFCSNRC